jgi:hypothetical protein
VVGERLPGLAAVGLLELRGVDFRQPDPEPFTHVGPAAEGVAIGDADHPAVERFGRGRHGSYEQGGKQVAQHEGIHAVRGGRG